MAVLHMTEAELARDLHGVLEKVQQGAEVVIEQDHRTIAVIRPGASPFHGAPSWLGVPKPAGRPIDEILREAEEMNSQVTLDDEFGKDLEEVIRMNQQPWIPPSWD